MKYNIDEVVNCIKPLQSWNIYSENLPEWSFVTDSRDCSGNWFVGLPGQRFNGNHYVIDAINNGALGVIVSEVHFDISEVSVPVLLVSDTLRAYQQLASYHLEKINNPLVIAITGSNGKTSTKNILECVLSVRHKTIATQKNNNNEIGVPLSIFQAGESTECLVLEFGMRGLGQIAELVEIAKPSISLITNIGTAHIEILGSIGAIAQAKAEIFGASDSFQKVYAPKVGQDLLRRFVSENPQHKYTWYHRPSNMHVGLGGLSFEYKGNQYQTKIYNPYVVYNMCGVIDLVCGLGFSVEEIQSGFSVYEAESGRGKIVPVGYNSRLIDETYNASPESVVALVESVEYISKDERKILILGDLAEQGEHVLKFMGELSGAINSFFDEVVLLESAMANMLSSHLEIEYSIWQGIGDIYDHLIKNNLLRDSIIAVKGSRVSQLDRLILMLIGE